MSSTVIVRGKGPREGFPDYVIKKYGSDRYGVYTGTVERRHKIGDKNQRIDPKWASTLYAPDPGWDIPCVDVDGDVRDAQYIANFRYEGSPASATYTPTDAQKTFNITGTMGDRRIELHPRFAELKAQFGWDEEQRTFAEFITGTGVTNRTALKVGGRKGERSPLSAVDSWFYIGLTYRISYASQTIPNELLAKIGTLIKAPPNIGKFKLPKATQNRRWLVIAPLIELRGNIAQISEEFLLGEPGGLPEAIYDAGQLTK